MIIMDANRIPGTGGWIVEVDILGAVAIFVIAVKRWEFVSKTFHAPHGFSVFKIDVRAIV